MGELKKCKCVWSLVNRWLLLIKLFVSFVCFTTVLANIWSTDIKELARLYILEILLSIYGPMLKSIEKILVRYYASPESITCCKVIWWIIHFFIWVILYFVQYIYLLKEIANFEDDWGYEAVKYCNIILAIKGAFDLIYNIGYSWFVDWVCWESTFKPKRNTSYRVND